MIFTALRLPQAWVWQAAGVGSIFAIVMILHVFTWFVVGVVMAPTYILLWLGSSCLFTNFGAIFLHKRLMQVELRRSLFQLVTKQNLVTRND